MTCKSIEYLPISDRAKKKVQEVIDSQLTDCDYHLTLSKGIGDIVIIENLSQITFPLFVDVTGL